MHAKRLVVVMVALVMTAGCVERFGHVDATGTEPTARLDSRHVVLIAIPQEDVGGRLSAEQIVALRMAAAFARHAKRVDIAPGNMQDLAVLLRVARKDRAGYLALPVTSTWGEHTEWLGRDHPSRGIAIFDVSSGLQIASAPWERSPPFLDFIGAGTQRPSPHLIDNYLDGLY